MVSDQMQPMHHSLQVNYTTDKPQSQENKHHTFIEFTKKHKKFRKKSLQTKKIMI